MWAFCFNTSVNTVELRESERKTETEKDTWKLVKKTNWEVEGKLDLCFFIEVYQ